MAEWRHDDDESRWEYGYCDDVAGTEHWVWSAYVTDEMIDRVALPAQLAARIFNKLGSVPPPLAEYLPPEPPVITTWVPKRVRRRRP